MNLIPRVFLYLQALGLGLLGLYFWVDPTAAGAAIGVSPLDTYGHGELRGFMGGGFVTMALLLVVGLRRLTAWSEGALAAVGLFMAMVVVGRLISAGVDGISAKSAGATVFELLIVLACWALLRQRAVAQAA